MAEIDLGRKVKSEVQARLALASVADHRIQLLDLEAAQALSEECSRLATRIGLVTFQATAQYQLGNIAAVHERWAAVLEHAELALRLYSHNRQPAQASKVRVLRSQALAELGRFDEAQRELDAALAESERKGLPRIPPERVYGVIADI